MANLASWVSQSSEGKVRRNFITDCSEAHDNVSGRNNSVLDWSFSKVSPIKMKSKSRSPKRPKILSSSNTIPTPVIPKPRLRRSCLRLKRTTRRRMDLNVSASSEVITISEDSSSDETPISTPPLTLSPPKSVKPEENVVELEEITEIVMRKSSEAAAVPLVDLSLEDGELVETEGEEDEVEIISVNYIGEKKTPTFGTSTSPKKNSSTPLTKSAKRKSRKSNKRRKSALTPAIIDLTPGNGGTGVEGNKKIKNASSGANAVLLGKPKFLRNVLSPIIGTPRDSKGIRAKALKRLGKTPWGTPILHKRLLAMSHTTAAGPVAARTWTERKYQEAHEFHNKSKKKKPAALRQPPHFNRGGGRKNQESSRQPLRALAIPYIPLAKTGNSKEQSELLPNPRFVGSGSGILGPIFGQPPALSYGHPNFNGDHRGTFPLPNVRQPPPSFVVRNPVANISSPGPSSQPDHVLRNTEQHVSIFGMNMFVPPIVEEKGKLRPIVIDGSNIAMGHGNNRHFSCRGIKICVEYFKRLGHETILAFVPRYRSKLSESIDTHILDELENEGIVRFTPSRDLDGGRRIASYDDRYVIQCAAAIGGIIVSNDNFRDLLKEEPTWRNIIETRLLQFTWVTADLLIFPQDPLGRNGPPLHAFLRF